MKLGGSFQNLKNGAPTPGLRHFSSEFLRASYTMLLLFERLSSSIPEIRFTQFSKSLPWPCPCPFSKEFITDKLVSPTVHQRFNLGVNSTEQCMTFVSLSAWRNFGKVYFSTERFSPVRPHPNILIIHNCFRFSIILCIWQWCCHFYVRCWENWPKFCVFAL